MVLPQRVSMVAPAAAAGALVSVPVAALVFVGLYAVGGTVDIPLDKLTTAMLGVHTLIGLGEAAITFLAVGSIVAVRPDLVYGARRVLATRSLELRTALAMRARVSTRWVVVAGVAVALLLAGVLSFYASGDPDGLTKVSEDQGFAQSEKEHGAGDGPLAGYETKGIADGRLSGGLAGVARLAGRAHDRRRRRARRPPAPYDGRRVLMGAPHGHKLHFHGHSWLHRLPAHVKLVALVAFMLTVVATPREWFPVFGGYLLVLVVLVATSHVPPTYLAKRMVVEVPFVLFAALLPFVATGPRTEVLGLSLSEHGLLGAWGLLAKGTLGVLASLLLAATTEPRALLAGLERLRVPPLLVQIMGFMIRYLDVVTDELRRMHVARESRGFSARDPRQWPVIAKSAGVLFIRSYERGERVHLAMLSRGYDGRMPR